MGRGFSEVRGMARRFPSKNRIPLAETRQENQCVADVLSACNEVMEISNDCRGEGENMAESGTKLKELSEALEGIIERFTIDK